MESKEEEERGQRDMKIQAAMEKSRSENPSKPYALITFPTQKQKKSRNGWTKSNFAVCYKEEDESHKHKFFEFSDNMDEVGYANKICITDVMQCIVLEDLDAFQKELQIKDVDHEVLFNAMKVAAKKCVRGIHTNKKKIEEVKDRIQKAEPDMDEEDVAEIAQNFIDKRKGSDDEDDDDDDDDDDDANDTMNDNSEENGKEKLIITKEKKRKNKVIKFMQWNQKWLRVAKDEKKVDDFNVRRDNICKTIKNADPDIVIMEEIMNQSDGGKEAIKRILKKLNEMQKKQEEKGKKGKGEWIGGVSDVVDEGSRERYACLYRPESVGTIITSKGNPIKKIDIDDNGYIEEDIGTKLFPYGFSPTLDGYASKEGTKTRGETKKKEDEFQNMMEKHYNKLRIGQTTINMTDSINVFEEYKKNCKHNWYFQRGDLSYHDVGYDYCPVLFSFQQNEGVNTTTTTTTAIATAATTTTTTTAIATATAISSDDNAINNSNYSNNNDNDNKLLFHVIGIHGSVGDVNAAAGGRNKTYSVPEQNIMEMLYLQNLCTMAAEKNELIVLLGDFNTQERSNGTMGLWDSNLNLPVVSKREWKYEEEEYLRDSREGFLYHYNRAIPSCFPTNVFPFLAGLTSIPKHNDDIWIPKTNTQGWSLKSGKCLEIDDFVLKAWDRKTQQFYEESRLLEFSAVGINDDDDNDKVDQDIVNADYRIQLAKDKIVEISDKEINKDNCDEIQKEIAKAKSRLADEMKKRKQLDNPSESQLRKATAINQKLVEIWSDHRPIVASIKISPESDGNT